MKRLDICKRSFLLLGCIIVITLVSDGVAQNQLPGIGAMGDSLTDEYQTDEYLSGLCWVEQLVKSRGLNFGAFSSTSRGEPRRSGYEYNWARVGATAIGDYPYDLPSQWAGLAEQVRTGKVTYICLCIGNNDLAGGNYDAIARDNLIGSDLEAFIDSVVGRIEVALDEVSSMGDVRLILCYITDHGETPPIRQKYNVEQRVRVTNAVMRANAKIMAIANQRVIPVIDVFGIGKNLFLQDTFTIGGVLINTKGTSNDPHNFFLSDGIHPGTVIQGLFANAFIEAMNRAYHADIEPLSDQEILANAGIADPNPGADPTYFDVSDFVLDPTAPWPDFNSDGIIDAVDMCLIIDHWHTDEPAFDIGPSPYGDGIIDVLDLTVLAEQLFTYPKAVAYWKLDETEGNRAYDSAGNNNGILMNDPVWQPESGIMAGALKFDGIDDYVRINNVLNPADGMFSVIAWIKTLASGQTFLSQVDGVSWLCTDSEGGCLMTELTCPGRSGGPLMSQRCITDGEWHHIGLVWDGYCRHLYVDGVEVAKDDNQLPGLVSSNGGLYLGTRACYTPDTFFSGMVDDVRIFNRVVRP